MTLAAIEHDFHTKVSSAISIAAEGLHRYRIFTPFLFDDGDHLSIVLRHAGEEWKLSDEGHTFMHLTYDLDESDLHRGNRQKIIAATLSRFGIQDRDGELILQIPDARFGDALFSFVQALLQITDVTYLSRERVHSTFHEDLRAFLAEQIPEDRRTFDWSDRTLDPQGMYVIDCRINGSERPIFVHALSSDDRTRDATIALLQFEKWDVHFRSLAIFEDQEAINRRVLARFTDVSGRQFSSLRANRDRIAEYLAESVAI